MSWFTVIISCGGKASVVLGLTKVILKTSAGSETGAQVSRASDAIKFDDQRTWRFQTGIVQISNTKLKSFVQDE